MSSGIERQSLLEADLVSPQVKEVIFVKEPLFRAKVQVPQPYLGWVIAEANTTGLVHAVSLAADDELVQMGICPAHRDLQGVVQIGNRAITAHQQPPPDKRADLAQPYSQLIYLDLGGLDPAILL